MLAHKELADKFDQLERNVGSHDEAIKQLVAAIRQLMTPPDPPKTEMGFHTIRNLARLREKSIKLLYCGIKYTLSQSKMLAKTID